MVGEPGESDGSLAPEWPSGPVYGQVPPPPPPAKPEPGPSREAWALALIAFAGALAFVASQHHGYDSGYELGRVLGTGAVSLVIATLLRHLYIRVVSGKGEAWHPWAIAAAAGVAVLSAAATWPAEGAGSLPDGSIAAFGSEAASCRASAPSPLVTGGVVSFQPVDQGTSHTLDAMLAQSSPTMAAQVQVREVSDGDLTPAMAFAVPGFSDPTLRAGFVAGLQSSAAQAGGTSVSVPGRGEAITLLQAGPRYVASSFDGCYAVMVAAPNQSAALRIEQEIIGQ